MLDRPAAPSLTRAPTDRAWLDAAVRRVEADFNRSADTHLIRVELPLPGLHLYLKDESSHPTGSLKHRLARSLVLHALCNGWVGPGTTLVEASSGSTAVSEAYFARLLGLPFVAVMPRATSPEKVAAIAFQGGRAHFVEDAREAPAEAARLARACGGHFLDQFTFAERATDWRGNNNIAESIHAQMAMEPHPVPEWIVCGAGTGGTSATLGRFARYRGLPTKLLVADPEASAFHRHHADPRVREVSGPPSLVEGIGRPRVEPSFVPAVVDRMIAVPDAASLGAMRALSARLGRRVGPSTGTNLWACAIVLTEMARAGRAGAVVTLLCDAGERYASTCCDEAWLRARGVDPTPYEARARAFLTEGTPVG